MHIKREIEEKVFLWMKEREIIAIIGPRQSGKTTMIERIKERALRQGSYDEDHIVFITFEDEIERLKFESDPSGYIQEYLYDKRPHLFLLDEVQNIENAGKALKLIFDRFHDRIKFVMTGSSGTDLRDIGSFLVGRAVFFELYPFDFGEFLLAKDERLHKYYIEHRLDPLGPFKEGRPMKLGKLHPLLEEYMMFGGFPRIVLMDDVGKKKVLLKQLVTLYIEKDILKVHGASFRNDALRVVQYLAYNCCGLLNKDVVSSELGIDKKKVAETIEILEGSFVIRRLRPYFKNLTTELRKMNKVYFIDNGMRNVLAEDFIYSRDKGLWLENHVFSELCRKDAKLKFWRTTAKAEVDFIYGDSVPVEVKSSSRITRSLTSFISTYQPKRTIVINYDEYCRTNMGGTELVYLPAVLL